MLLPCYAPEVAAVFSREHCDYLCFTRFDAAWSKEIFTATHLLDTESIEVIVLTFYLREVYFQSVFYMCVCPTDVLGDST